VLDARNEQMLVALRKLCAQPRHGIPLSTRQIARATGFDKEHILNIERSALRKMRNRLPPDVKDAFNELLARDRETAQDALHKK
jgi:DNA-directed RNA polymerase sigma subunit (sigma70/sigma32)